MALIKSLRRKLSRQVRSSLLDRGYHVVRLNDEDRYYFSRMGDDSQPLPPGADDALRSDHPDLQALRQTYANLILPVCQHSQWNRDYLKVLLDLRYFRGDNAYIWQYRDLTQTTALKYYVFMKYVQSQDERGLLQKLGEDGAFGCWTQDFGGVRYSRDLLDSANEIGFLDRSMGLLQRQGLRVLDIGAGYGRLAHRITAAADVADYCCVDAIPESTYLCQYYLRHRGLQDQVRVLPLDQVESGLAGASFDLAMNVHSFSECTYAAVQWWLQLVVRLQIPYLFIVPNEAEGMLTVEPNGGGRRDFSPLIAAAGYELVKQEHVFTDPDVRKLLAVHDQHYLYRRAAS
jgi:putative sugar O-methyltransferase